MVEAALREAFEEMTQTLAAARMFAELGDWAEVRRALAAHAMAAREAGRLVPQG